MTPPKVYTATVITYQLQGDMHVPGGRNNLPPTLSGKAGDWIVADLQNIDRPPEVMTQYQFAEFIKLFQEVDNTNPSD